MIFMTNMYHFHFGDFGKKSQKSAASLGMKHMKKQQGKIFGVGLSRTGTQSLTQALTGGN
ncbi:MAG: hypothetical protein SWH78_10245 [Thermodesulfobacteriota bacterium]|nr:hypothetical protein [Thermodesulfobacteriota bacterium]